MKDDINIFEVYFDFWNSFFFPDICNNELERTRAELEFWKETAMRYIN
jgi:hypothetical protein